ncbi:putative gamma interferon inducible lysosomal thiol reductase GILT [Helianthus anomalus]
MEAHLHRSKNVIVLLVLIVSLAATLVQSSATPVAGEKVKLALYYEALCPSCTYFILNDLSKIFDNGLIDIVDLKLSPYGNAKISSNGTIVCQVCCHLLLYSIYILILHPGADLCVLLGVPAHTLKKIVSFLGKKKPTTPLENTLEPLIRTPSK